MFFPTNTRISRQVNPTLILVEIVYPKFAEDSRDMLLDIMEEAKAKGEEVLVEDAFAVYAKLCEIRRIYLDVFPKYELLVHFTSLGTS